MIATFNKELHRSWILVFRNRSDIINAWLFFVMVVSLFPLAISPDPHMLTLMAPSVIWVAVLLSHLLSFSQLFVHDYLDGSLDHYLLSPEPLSWLIFCKVWVHWLLLTIPVMLMIPLLAIMYHLSWHATVTLWVTILLGTPTLVFTGAIMAALTVTLRSNGLLLSLLLLPLYVPVMVFSSMAVIAAQHSLPVVAELSILMAVMLLALFIAPIVVVAALRIGSGCQSY